MVGRVASVGMAAHGPRGMYRAHYRTLHTGTARLGERGHAIYCGGDLFPCDHRRHVPGRPHGEVCRAIPLRVALYLHLASLTPCRRKPPGGFYWCTGILPWCVT